MNSLPLELDVAVRYLKSRPSRLVSSVSLLSIAGIAVGVAALVVAMGLLSGYRTEIREKLIGANAPVVVFPLIPGGDPDPSGLEKRIAAVPGVQATAPVIYQTGVAASAATPDGVDAVLKGVDPAAERRVSDLDVYVPDPERVLTRGAPDVLPGVAIGAELAAKLDVREGDPITLAVADASRRGRPLRSAHRAVPRRPHLPDELLGVRHGVGLPRPRGAPPARPHGGPRERRRGAPGIAGAKRRPRPRRSAARPATATRSRTGAR